MEILVDGKKQFTLQSNPGTVGGVLIEVNEYLESNGRALQGVVADGQPVPPDEIMGRFGRLNVSEVSSLNIISANVLELVDDSINELKEVLPELPAACQALSEVLASESPQDGFSAFNQLIEVWEVLQERRTQIANALGLDVYEAKLGDTALVTREEALSAALAQARKLMEESDFVALADLMAHELSDLADQEGGVVGVLEAARKG